MLARQHVHGREHATGHPALTDAQTGLANGLHFDLVYSYLFAAGDRGLSFTVMLVSLGGPDRVPKDSLKTVGQKVRATTRDSDLVAHVGSGRYVILLLGTNLPGARIAADRLELALAEVAESRAAFGLVAYNRAMKESAELLEMADRALLTAESAGGGVELA
jgi:GGDEF domain-containing protein